jgi:hypothetical protein
MRSTNGCFWREADIELKGGARRRLVDSATLGVDDINGG